MTSISLSISDFNLSVDYDTYDCQHESTDTMEYTCGTVEWLCESSHESMVDKISISIEELEQFAKQLIENIRVVDGEHKYTHETAKMLEENFVHHFSNSLRVELEESSNDVIFDLQDNFKEEITYRWRSEHGHSIGIAYGEGFEDAVNEVESEIANYNEEILSELIGSDNKFSNLLEGLDAERHENLLNVLLKPYGDDEPSSLSSETLIINNLKKADIVYQRAQELYELRGTQKIASLFPEKEPETFLDWYNIGKKVNVFYDNESGKTSIEIPNSHKKFSLM